jgi:uncharacterized protein (DUF427 family)
MREFIMALVVKERHTGSVIASAEENAGVRVFEGNWYYNQNNVDMQYLKVTNRVYTCPYKGRCYWIDVEAPDGTKAQNVAWTYFDVKPGYEFIQGEIGFYARPTSGTLIDRA